MLNQGNNHSLYPPPSAPSPDYPDTLLSNFDAFRVSKQIAPLKLAANMISGFDDAQELSLQALPTPWSMFAFMGLGAVLCCITCIGHIAAETINGCCLCFFTLLTTVLILLEAVMVAFIVIDHNWEKDLPFGPTGELDSFRDCIEDNANVCKWVGISVVIIQALALFLAMILSRRDSRNNRTALFDDIEKGGINPSYSYSSHEIDEHDNDGAVDGLQDRVTLLKRLTGDIHEEVESQNNMLDRMGNDMDASRGVVSGTTDKLEMVFETKSSRRMFTLVASFVAILLVLYYLSR